MTYDIDNCAPGVNLTYDVVREDESGKTTRLGTYGSAKLAALTSDEYPGSRVWLGRHPATKSEGGAS